MEKEGEGGNNNSKRITICKEVMHNGIVYLLLTSA